MHTLNSTGKKGQTIIEVTVALTIMIIVFAGVVNLVLRVFNISMSARNMTIASSTAQYGISEGIKRIQGSCNIQDYSGEDYIIREESADGFTLLVTQETLETDGETKDSKQITNANFIKLKAQVCWVDKGLPGDNRCKDNPNARSFELSQLVAK